MMGKYSAVRGFNYQPSYGATGCEIWRNFKADIIKKELGLGKKYFPGINTIRAWLSFDAFLVDNDQFEEAFEQYIAIADGHGLKIIPTLFNNWHSLPDYGGVAEETIRSWFKCRSSAGAATPYVFDLYLDRIVGKHSNDSRILLWDLCNEPFNSGPVDLFNEWVTYLYNYCKSTINPIQPVGVSIGDTVKSMQIVEAASDVFLLHLYFAAKEQPAKDVIEHYKKIGLDPPESVGKLVEYAKSVGKPILCTECCWGSLDDAERAKIISSELEALVHHDIGFLAHALHESLVADLHGPQYGPVSRAGNMVFINMDGTLRKHHEVFNKY